MANVESTVTQNLPPGKLPKPGKIGKLGVGMGVAFAGIDAVSRVSNGEGLLSSIGKATASALMWDTGMALLGPYAIPAMIGVGVANAVGSMAIENGRKNVGRVASAYGGAGKYNNVVNSDAAATMRQRGMAMINQNGEATRSVLGGEARAYFRSSMSQY